ncbi:MAG: DNA gyrase inhibitor YacG [Steroidobacteraceae bacterium]|nr:DNA gyrase inhibitor YacG [Steroidobacteraceae bacterium]
MSPALHRCPSCRRELEWSASNPHRPFCSERCRLIDLGAWLKEEHAIPGEPAMDVGADAGECTDAPPRPH